MGDVLKGVLTGVAIGFIAFYTGGAGLGLLGTTTLLGSVGVGAAIGGISAMFKPKFPDLSSEFGRELQLNGDPTAPRKIPYGEAWTAGTLRYHNTAGDNNEDLYLLIVLAGVGIDSVPTVEVDGGEVTIDGSGEVTFPARWAGLINIRFHLGTDDQLADATLVSLFSADPIAPWTTDHRLRSLPYAIVKLTFDEEDMNAIPQIRFQLRGRKVYSARLDTSLGGTHNLADPTTWEWSRNATDCAADFMRGIQVNGRAIAGMRAASTRFDSANIIAEANVCDEDVALAAGGTQDRYCVDGFIDPRQDHGANLRHFEVAMAGDITFADGKWRFFAGAFRTPTLHLEDKHFIGPLRHTVHKGESARVDAVQGVFASASDSGDVLDYPPVPLASAVTGEERFMRMDFALVSDGAQGQRCAKLMLEREAAGKRITCTTSLYGFRAVPGETIEITRSSFGLSAQDMRVLDVQLTIVKDGDKTGLAVELILEAGPSSLYTWAAEETAIAAVPAIPRAQVPFYVSLDGIVSGLINPGFETGDLTGWVQELGTWSVETDEPRSGTYNARALDDGGAATLSNVARLNVDEDDRVLAMGFAQVASLGTTGFSRVRVSFRDAADAEVGSAFGNGITAFSYGLSRRVAPAPAGAVTAVFQYQLAGSDGLDGLFDDAYFAIVPKDGDLESFDGDGLLIEDIGAGDGSNYRSVSRGAEAGSCRDGDAVTFSPVWSSIPTVKFLSGGISFSPTLNNSQAIDFRALNLTGSGFDAHLKIKELVGSTTTHTDTTVSTPSSPSGLDHSINKSQAAEAWDNQYTFQFDVTVRNFSDGGGGWIAGSATVGIYTNDGSGWLLRESRQYFGNPLDGIETAYSNRTVTVTVGGLGAGDDFGINIDSGLASSLNFDSVEYETATAPATESATPAGAPDVQYLVIGG